jgi:hypothetical protein
MGKSEAEGVHQGLGPAPEACPELVEGGASRFQPGISNPWLIPAVEDVVLEVDLAGGRLTVRLMEGLI